MKGHVRLIYLVIFLSYKDFSLWKALQLNICHIMLGKSSQFSSIRWLRWKKTLYTASQQETADLVTFAEEILIGKLHFFVQWQLCQGYSIKNGLVSPIFIVSNSYCVINYLKTNHITVCRAKYLAIMTLKVLPTSCYHYHCGKLNAKYKNEAKQDYGKLPC